MVSGTVTAVIFTWKKKPKIDRIRKNYLGDDSPEARKEMIVEMVKEVAPAAIPVTLMEVAGVSFILGGQKELLKSNAALGTAYAISEAAFKRYKENVIEEIGEKKQQKIYDKTAQDIANASPVPENQVIVTSNGNTYCKDLLSGQEFISDMEEIRGARNRLNEILNEDDYASLNDCYYLLGIGSNDIGDLLGWNRQRDGLVDFIFSSALVKGKPCLTIAFDPAPTYGFDKMG